MKRFDVHSFRFRLWAALVGFAVLVCGLMWVVQITTIRTTYENDRIDRLKQAGNIISSTYGREGFAESLRSVARSGFFIQILREDGVLLRSLGNDGADAPPPQEDLVDYGIFARLDGTDGYYFYRVPDTVHDSEWLVQVQVVALQDGLREVLFTSTNMVPVSTTLSMLSSRFLLVTAVVLVVATVLAFLLASNLSRPITQITQRALRLAGGDYGVDFPKGSCTELDHLSHALDTAATEFSNTEALRRDLIANVSHDMRTPLTMIRAYAEMVQQISGADPVKREAHLDVIVRETEKLTRFVNETLDLSRLLSGTMELNMEVFALAESVERALGDFRHLWEREGYRLFLSLDRDVLVRGDRQQLERAAFNLISNAFNYTGGDKLVYVGVSRWAGEGLFEVIDTGGGISTEQLREIWERYYKINRFDKNAASTGVGLSIVKAILELHHARYSADSREGEGSRFWFALPCE